MDDSLLDAVREADGAIEVAVPDAAPGADHMPVRGRA